MTSRLEKRLPVARKYLHFSFSCSRLLPQQTITGYRSFLVNV